jgi:hypothetical protein
MVTTHYQKHSFRFKNTVKEALLSLLWVNKRKKRQKLLKTGGFRRPVKCSA